MQNEPIVIGLVGPSGSGKTTACRHIQRYGFLLMHPARPLKIGFAEMFGVRDAYCEQPLVDQPADFLGGQTPRAVLEQLGHRLHEVAPAALPKMLDQRINRVARILSPRILVDGIRRATEAAVVRKYGGTVIRLQGKPVDPDKPCDMTQTEVEADHVVDFAPTVEMLHEQLDLIVRPLLP